MKSTIFLSLIAVILIACQKDHVTVIPHHYISTTTDTINFVHLISFNRVSGFDTTYEAANAVGQYIFSLSSDPADSLATDQLMGQYAVTPRYDVAGFKIRFTGQYNLLNADSIIKRDNESIIYAINNSLRGKPLFEVYYADSNLVAKRLIASGTSVWVKVSYKPDMITPNTTITKAFQHVLLASVASEFTYSTVFHRL